MRRTVRRLRWLLSLLTSLPPIVAGWSWLVPGSAMAQTGSPVIIEWDSQPFPAYEGPEIETPSGPTGLAEPCAFPPPSERGTWVGFLGGYRQFRSLVHDSRRNRFIVFGGDSDVGAPYVSNRCWEIALDAPDRWREVCIDGEPPEARQDAAMAYDSTGDQVILFGGIARPNGQHQHMRDVWALKLGGRPRWIRLDPAGEGIPLSTYLQFLVLDERRRRALFVTKDDVWSLPLDDPPTWSKVGAAFPEPYNLGAVTHDSRRNRLVGFGGSRQVCTHHGCTWQYYQDLWVLSPGPAARWIRIQPSGPVPLSRDVSGLAYDRKNDRVVMAGGLVLGGGMHNRFRDTWMLTFEPEPRWQQLPVAQVGEPPQEPFHLSYDPGRERMLTSGHVIWSLPLAEHQPWHQVLAAPRWPGTLYNNSVVHDPVGRRMLMFGGDPSGPGSPSNLTWALGLDDRRWSILDPTGAAPARWGHSAVLDPARARMVIFGGFVSGASDAVQSDVWALTLEGRPAWTQLNPTGPGPSGRWYHSAIYDPIGDRMIMLGGRDGRGQYLADVWALSLGESPRWEELFPAGGPVSPRWGPAGYDPASYRVIALTSIDDYGRSDAWALELSGEPAWKAVGGSGLRPPSRGLVFDETRSRMLAVAEADVWQLGPGAEPTWSPVTPVGEMYSRMSGVIYDPVADRLVAYGEWSGGASLLHWGKPPRAVVIDLRGRNGTNPDGHGALSASVLSSADFDATRVDPASLTLAYAPLRREGNGSPRTTIRDVNGDDRPDLVGHFDADHMRIGPADSVLVLRGTTLDGERIRGVDRFRPPGRPGRGASRTATRPVETPEFGIRTLQTIPSSGLAISFSLESELPARLEVFDLQGRRVLQRELRGLDAGEQRVSLGEAGRLPRGLYFVRLAQQDRSAVRRVVILE